MFLAKGWFKRRDVLSEVKRESLGVGYWSLLLVFTVGSLLSSIGSVVVTKRRTPTHPGLSLSWSKTKA